MIAWLEGEIHELEPNRVILKSGGVGYSVNIPLSTWYQLENQTSAELRIHTHVREDTLALYGFASTLEKATFEKLITISGIGPRLAQTILSGMDVSDLVTAIASNDAGRLNSIPGVGKKTAERICLELKDKIDVSVLEPSATVSPGATTIEADVTSALVNLGYKEAGARKAIEKARADLDDEPGFSELLRVALRHLSGG